MSAVSALARSGRRAGSEGSEKAQLKSPVFSYSEEEEVLGLEGDSCVAARCEHPF